MTGAAFLEIADSEVRDLLFADYFEEVALEVWPLDVELCFTGHFAVDSHGTTSRLA